MTDASIQPQQSALVEGPDGAEKPSEAVIAQVASEFGVHPLKQLKEMMLMRMGAQKLGANEYYDLRVFDPAHDRAGRKAFLGQGAINALNLAINPDTLMETKNFVGNKLAYTAHLNENGIASTKTQAFVSTAYESDADFVLKSADQVVAFMKEKAAYPLFGKPQGGSLSVGSVRIEKIDGDTLTLGNGTSVSVTQFADDVLCEYKDGYLLQTALVPHPDIQKITGDVVGSVRVVTAHDGTSAKPVYCVWKIPAPDAMSDNFWQDGSMLALLEMDTGTVVQCHKGKGPSAEFVKTHPTTGVPLEGFTLPHWQAVLQSACAAHDLFPDLGVCGFDIGIGADGPVIVECNDQPNHMLYQFPARKGVNNAAFGPIWKALSKRKR